MGTPVKSDPSPSSPSMPTASNVCVVPSLLSFRDVTSTNTLLTSQCQKSENVTVLVFHQYHGYWGCYSIRQGSIYAHKCSNLTLMSKEHEEQQHVEDANKCCCRNSSSPRGQGIELILCNGSAVYFHYATNASSVSRRWESLLR